MNCLFPRQPKDNRVLINVPHLSIEGGVTNYFNALRLTEYDNITYFFVNRRREGNWLSKSFFLFFVYLKFLWKVRSYRLVHLNVSLNFKSYYRDMGFLILLKWLGKRCVVFFHGWDTAFERTIAESKWQKRLFQRTYGRMDACIVLGTIYEEKLRRLGVPEECPFYRETTVADDQYINELDITRKLEPSSTIRILFLARILKEKGVYIALRAFQQVQRKITSAVSLSVTLNIAGDGPELARVKAYVQQENISDVTFSGYVRERQKHEVLTASHILLFPTYYPEGQPSVNLEAMLYGMPVITRSVAGVPDLLKHGDHGLLTLATDTDVFADFLEELVTNQALREKMGRDNHQRALQEFVPSQIVPRILTIYRQVVADRSPQLESAPHPQQCSA